MDSKYLKCECDSKNGEININNAESFSGKSVYQSFYDVLKYSNYKVLKCYKLVITFKSFSLKNISGSILTLAFFLFYSIFLIIYAVKGIKKLKVSKIMREHFGNNNENKNKNKDKSGVNHAKQNQKEKQKYENIKYKENSKKLNNKDTNKRSIYQNPPKKKISIYKRPISSFKFKNQEEKVKNIDNIFSMSKSSFIKSKSRRNLKDKNKYEKSKKINLITIN